VFIVSLPCTAEQEGDVRLVDGSSVYEGRVQVCHEEEWGTICNLSWDYREAAVVCRQLGYPFAGGYTVKHALGK
jgi:deleted-in-malignant-brain-tumors protein 1